MRIFHIEQWKKNFSSFSDLSRIPENIIIFFENDFSENIFKHVTFFVK